MRMSVVWLVGDPRSRRRLIEYPYPGVGGLLYTHKKQNKSERHISYIILYPLSLTISFFFIFQ